MPCDVVDSESADNELVKCPADGASSLVTYSTVLS